MGCSFEHKYYKLKKDLPMFNVRDRFYIGKYGGLWKYDSFDIHGEPEPIICAYTRSNLEEFPNILTEWFEEIVEEPEIELPGQYVAKKGEKFFIPVVSAAGDIIIQECIESGCSNSKVSRFGMSFESILECQEYLDKQKAYQILRQDAKGFEPDWKNPSQRKWLAIYNHAYDELEAVWNDENQHVGTVYFASEEAIKFSFKKHRKEWLTVLGVEK